LYSTEVKTELGCTNELHLFLKMLLCKHSHPAMHTDATESGRRISAYVEVYY